MPDTMSWIVVGYKFLMLVLPTDFNNARAGRRIGLYTAHIGPEYSRRAMSSDSRSPARLASGRSNSSATVLALRPATMDPTPHVGRAPFLSFHVVVSTPPAPTTNQNSRSGVHMRSGLLGGENSVCESEEMQCSPSMSRSSSEPMQPSWSSSAQSRSFLSPNTPLLTNVLGSKQSLACRFATTFPTDAATTLAFAATSAGGVVGLCAHSSSRASW
mmetsp:Transcript_3076/g.4921  ORF Transcript_3076/g.4921 Transcript_3076/m.4921 type:complete len:215 (+) Transcript_3076:417-1061(+)